MIEEVNNNEQLPPAEVAETPKMVIQDPEPNRSSVFEDPEPEEEEPREVIEEEEIEDDPEARRYAEHLEGYQEYLEEIRGDGINYGDY